MCALNTYLLILTVFSTFLLFSHVYGLEDLMGTEMQECINCLCHARSGCWSRHNCARYSISKDYWRTAGSLSVGSHSNSDAAFSSCMDDENCILNTVKRYTGSFGKLDCNCDGIFNCKDRFAVHLYGQNCMNPQFGDKYANRFNDCADDIQVSRMSSIEGDCEPETFGLFV